MDSFELIKYISDSEKKTPLKVYIKGDLGFLNAGEFEYYGSDKAGVLFCSLDEFGRILSAHENNIHNYRIENDRRNSALPLADLTKYNARIEPGSVIRELVEIGDNCVIMMGAVINIGAVIGERTMIDMNAVIGGRAVIGNGCHIGAGAVVAGVIEPPNANPVTIGNNVLMGANSVVLEGVRIGDGAVIAAGAVVVSDVEADSVMAGAPARLIKKVDEKTRSKTILIEELRKL
ncbi:MAG: 2,3,4,5-tetrahydropyridine-2,6-dicarboxylate N-acetyltransferase [Bacteroidota bacterium]